MPQRRASLRQTIESVLPQCDELHIYLNDFSEIPNWLYHHKIFIYASQNEIGDLGDVGKFYNVENEKGYIFTIDDDLVYPPTYAEDCIQEIEACQRKAVVTCHGRIFPNRPIASLYRDYDEAFHCLRYTRRSFIHMLGTGVTAFHSDTIIPPFSIFKRKNMADVWLSILLQKKKIPILCMQHRDGYIRESEKYDRSYTIWNYLHNNDQYQTEQINKIHSWQIYTV